MATPRYRSILRTLLGSVLQSNLSNSDLALLSNELRRGQLPDELAYMIDQTINHFRDEFPSRGKNSWRKEAESLIRSKKISKETLFNILSSLGLGEFSDISRSATVREILEIFLDNSSPSKADKLLDILNSSGSSDPFLKGISEKRS